MTKNEKLKTYGFTEKSQILSSIERCCDIFGNGSTNAAKVMIEKTIKHETHFGEFPDKHRKTGEGLSQFDEPTFDWVIKKLTTDTDYKDDIELLYKYYGIDIFNVTYQNLRFNLDLQSFLTRMKYKFVPSAFPIDDLGQYEYYKKHWNSSKGDATYEKWVQDTKNCFFKVGD